MFFNLFFLLWGRIFFVLNLTLFTSLLFFFPEKRRWRPSYFALHSQFGELLVGCGPWYLPWPQSQHWKYLCSILMGGNWSSKALQEKTSSRKSFFIFLKFMCAFQVLVFKKNVLFYVFFENHSFQRMGFFDVFARSQVCVWYYSKTNLWLTDPSVTCKFTYTIYYLHFPEHAALFFLKILKKPWVLHSPPLCLRDGTILFRKIFMIKYTSRDIGVWKG